jgi:recombination protein RecR
MFSSKIKQLISVLQQLPSIGSKSAQRLVFYLLSEQGRRIGLTIANSLEDVMANIGNCRRCRIYTEDRICRLCSNAKRDTRILCIVESPVDVYAIEQTNAYQGLYFVLLGHLSPLDNMSPKDIGLPELFRRLETEDINEVIIATNTTVEGEATSHYIVQHAPSHIKYTRIAYGIPIGGELEYLDHYTLRHALSARMAIIQNTREKKKDGF